MMSRHPRARTLACTITVVVMVAVSPGIAQRLTEAQIFLELNDTDGDLGIHASIDGEAWTSLKIIGPEGLLLDIFTRDGFRSQGLTQVSFESAEPPFDELSPSRFFRRFPEGRYAISAKALNGSTIRGAAMLSHVLAAPPENVLLNGLAASESCDDPLPTVVSPVMIDWDPVTEAHPRIGKRGSVTVAEYQLFVEGEGPHLSITLPPSVTQFDVPAAVTDGGGEFKFEIITRTSTGNNTAIESCFRVN